jgi:hypothetical protein
LELKITDKIFVRPEKKLEQVFPEICKYSCSKNGEVRNFVLVRDAHKASLFKYSFSLFEGIRITCDNCAWTSRMPASFAKKAFKHGLKSHLLIEYSKNKLITSWGLNFWASLWRVWMISFGVLIITTILQFRSQPVLIGSPKSISFEDAFKGENIGKIVKINGVVDYTAALSKEDYITKEGAKKLLGKEVYLPFFSKTKITDFFVIKGGEQQVNDVNSRINIRNYELLRNQDYTITGRLESLNTFDNADLQQFFLIDFPREKKLNTPEIVINSADLKTLKTFASIFIPFYLLLVILLASSVSLQVYIDKKIISK